MKKILLAAGDRCGLLKVLPLYKALCEHDDYEAVLAAGAPLPEGERSGEKLPGVFGVSENVVPVEAGGGTSVNQIASAMNALGELFASEQPDLAVIAGDDDVSLAAALAAAKLSLPVASVGAGLRDYNRRSPAEINRVLIDSVTDILFVSEHSGEYNLISEGVEKDRIFFVGEMLIDSLVAVIGRSNSSAVVDELRLEAKKYILVILDQAASLDSIDVLKNIEGVVKAIAEKQPVLMLLGPDVATVLQEHEMELAFTSVQGVQVRPLAAYVELLRLIKDALFVLTDSSLAQVESTVMKVPCLTMLDDTTSPATIEIGTNVLVGDRQEDILQGVDEAFQGNLTKRMAIPEKWDGAVTGRIIGVLDRVL